MIKDNEAGLDSTSFSIYHYSMFDTQASVISEC